MSRIKESLVNTWYTYLIGQCDEACLELGLELVPKQKIFNVLQKIGRKPITYKSDFPRKKRGLISENQVKYVEDIIFREAHQTLG